MKKERFQRRNKVASKERRTTWNETKQPRRERDRRRNQGEDHDMWRTGASIIHQGSGAGRSEGLAKEPLGRVFKGKREPAKGLRRLGGMKRHIEIRVKGEYLSLLVN